jgi:hypothetical protein
MTLQSGMGGCYTLALGWQCMCREQQVEGVLISVLLVHVCILQRSCLFVETSAKANLAVGQAFQELLLKVCFTVW